MARKGITFDRVAEVAEQLLLSNINPTNESVRATLGTGSNSTIAKHLRDWRTARLHDGIEKTPKAVHPMFPELTALQAKLEREKLSAVNMLEKKIKKLSVINTERQMEIERLKTENKLLNDQTGAQYVTSLKLKNENQALIQENAGLIERVAQLEDKLDRHQHQTNTLATQLEKQVKHQAQQNKAHLAHIEKHYKARLDQAMQLQEEYRTQRMVDVDRLHTENLKLRDKLLAFERKYTALQVVFKGGDDD